MYWTLKRVFPGDQDFSYEKFWRLPYEYVLHAYIEALKARQTTLHEEERPVSLMMTMFANSNRDPKKTPEFKVDQFYLYQPRDESSGPKGAVGAAMLELIEKEVYPAWALFCFKEIAESAAGAAPGLLAFIGEDCMLLAPEWAEAGYKGTLLALRSSSEQTRWMTSPCGKKIMVSIPKIRSEASAEEDVFLPCLSQTGT